MNISSFFIERPIFADNESNCAAIAELIPHPCSLIDLGSGAGLPGVVAVSNSYGGGESGSQYYESYYNHPGIAVTASAGDSGSSVIASRVSRELQNFDRTSKLKPAISSTTLHLLPGESGEEHFDEIAARIERLIQAHLLDKESLK